jgi:hypothetical protein
MDQKVYNSNKDLANSNVLKEKEEKEGFFIK